MIVFMHVYTIVIINYLDYDQNLLIISSDLIILLYEVNGMI